MKLLTRGKVVTALCLCVLGVCVDGVLAADLTYKSTTLVVSPYVEVSVTQDSNRDLSSTNEESDVYYEGKIGINLGIQAKSFTLNMLGYTFSRTYTDEGPVDQEKTSAGERLGLTFGERRKLVVSIDQSYERVTDYSAAEDQGNQTSVLSQDRSERRRRDVSGAGLQLGRDLTDKIGMDAGYTYAEDDYVSETLLDSTRHDVYGEVSYLVTDKSSVFLHGNYGTEKSDGYLDEAQKETVRVGWKTRVTHKVNFRGSVGYESYDSGPLVGKSEESENESSSFALAGEWRPVDKLSLILSGAQHIEAATTEANTRQIALVRAGASYRMFDDVSWSAGVSYRTDDYDLPTEGHGEAREVDTVGVNLGLNYRPFDHVLAFATLSYEDASSNIEGEDFDQTRAGLGVRVGY